MANDQLTWLHQTAAPITSGNVVRKDFIYKAKERRLKSQMVGITIAQQPEAFLFLKASESEPLIQSRLNSLVQETQWDVKNVPWASIRSSPSNPATRSRVSMFWIKTHTHLKVPYYTVCHQYITGLRYIQNLSLIGWNTKQIIAASHNSLCFSPVSKVLILCLLL